MDDKVFDFATLLADDKIFVIATCHWGQQQYQTCLIVGFLLFFRVIFGHPAMLQLPTNVAKFIMSPSDISLTTIQLKDGGHERYRLSPTKNTFLVISEASSPFPIAVFLCLEELPYRKDLH